MGFDAVAESLAKGNAPLVLLAQDLSAGTEKRVRRAAGNAPVLRLPYTQAQLQSITRKPAGVLAVTNKDLAALCAGAAGQA